MANVENGRKKGMFSPAELARALLLQSSGQVPQNEIRQGFVRLGEFSTGKGFVTLSSHSAPKPDTKITDEPAGIWPSKPDNRPPGVQVGEGPEQGTIIVDEGGPAVMGVVGKSDVTIITEESGGDISIGQQDGNENIIIESGKD